MTSARPRQPRIRLRVVLIVLQLAAVGCGGNSSDSPSSPSPINSTARVIAQGSFALQAPLADEAYFQVVPVTDAARGDWEATVDWTTVSNALRMYVANGTCTGDQFASAACPDSATCACQFTVRSETNTPKPRVLSIENAPGGTRTLIVWNLGPREESVNYTVRLRSTTLGLVEGGRGDDDEGRRAASSGRKARPATP